MKTELGNEKTCFKRERDNYKLPAVASCQYIRTLYDVIGQDQDGAQGDDISATDDPPCMVFEWMEHDLRIVTSDPFRDHSNLPKIIAKSILSALAVLKTQFNAIHTGNCPFSLQSING